MDQGTRDNGLWGRAGDQGTRDNGLLDRVMAVCTRGSLIVLPDGAAERPGEDRLRDCLSAELHRTAGLASKSGREAATESGGVRQSTP